MGGVAIPAGACVHTQARALGAGEPRQRQVIEIDEATEQIARRIDFDGEPPFGEVDLHFVRALLKTAANLGDVLAQQVTNECLAWVLGNSFRWIHQAQSRWRNNGLFKRNVGVTQRPIQIAIRVPLIAERPGRKARHSSDVSGAKGDLESVGCGVRKAVDAVGPEIVVLPLLPVRDHGGSGGLELLDGIPRGLLV